MRRVKAPVELMLTNRKGRIRFITSPLARSLGHPSPRSLRKVDIGELLPQPFGALHAGWIRVSRLGEWEKGAIISCESNEYGRGRRQGQAGAVGPRTGSGCVRGGWGARDVVSARPVNDEM